MVALDMGAAPPRPSRLRLARLGQRQAALVRAVCDAATAVGVALLLVGDSSAIGAVVTSLALGLGTLVTTVRRAALLRAALVSASMTLVLLRGQQLGSIGLVENTRVLLVLTVAVTCAMLAERRATESAVTAVSAAGLADPAIAWRRDPVAFERLLTRTTGHFAVMVVGVDNLPLLSRLWGADVATAAVRCIDRVIGDWGIGIGAPYAQTTPDEFTVLLPNASTASVKAAADRLLFAAATTSDDGLRASISIGWSLGGDAFAGSAPPLATWTAAREALTLAKDRGGGGVLRAGEQRPSDIISANPLQRLVATIPMRAALEPVVDLRGGGVLGVEALAQPVSAAADGSVTGLFAAAREIGAIAELEDVCRLAGVAAFARVPVSLQVQISVAMVGSHGGAHAGAEELADLVDTIGRPCSSVVLGLSDDGYLDRDAIVEIATAYRDRGFLLALDGGTDVDTIAWLVRRLRPAILKIDRTMLGRTVLNATVRREVGELVVYATGLDCLVVAKAIETQEILDRVLALGIGAGQGRFLDAAVALTTRQVTAPQAA